MIRRRKPEARGDSFSTSLSISVMDNVIIYIIVGVVWAVASQWKKMQARDAEQDYQGQRQKDAPPPVGPSTTPGTPAYDTARRYQEIQDEIRRRIAQRTNRPMPAPTSTIQPAQPRPVQPVMVPTGYPSATQPPPPIVRPQPAAAVTSPVAASPFAMTMGDLPSAMTDIWKQNTSAASDEARAYSMTATQESTSLSALRTALASASSARHAFILREVLDRPLCARPLSSGGHDNWN
jgi:hypothetical protein